MALRSTVVSGFLTGAGSAMSLVLSATIVFTFLFSSVSKIRSATAWHLFLASVQQLNLPKWAARPVAIGVVAAEIAVTVAVAIPFSSKAGLIGATILLLAFTGVIIHSIATKTEAGCNCFGGTSTRPFSLIHLVRNGILLAVAVSAMLAPAPFPDLSPLSWVIGGLVALLAAATISVFDDFASLIAP